MSGYICDLNESVERNHARYPNRYGLMLAGDLYTSKTMDKTKPQAAVVVGAPYGGVKEQGPCVYANELARRGFAVLTFDPCYMGESEGEPCHVSSPELFTENFSAGVDFLGLLPFVDRERIAVLGICGSGGFALSAAQADTRIKAVVTAGMYDMTVAARMGQTPQQLLETKNRWLLSVGKMQKTGICPNTSPFSPKHRWKRYLRVCASRMPNGFAFMQSNAVTTRGHAEVLQPPAIFRLSILNCFLIWMKSLPVRFCLLSATGRILVFSAKELMKKRLSLKKCLWLKMRNTLICMTGLTGFLLTR